MTLLSHQMRSSPLDFNNLIKDHPVINYHNYVNHQSKKGINIYGIDQLPIDRNKIKALIDTPLIIILRVIEVLQPDDMDLLSDPNITVICQQLKHYQQLLSYKSSDQVFIDHHQLLIPKKIILLLRDPKRVDHVEQQVKPHLKSLKIVPAIDAKSPNAIEFYSQNNQIPVVNPIRRGKIGCAFSHQNIWKDLNLSLSPSYIVLEDDIQPNQSSERIIDQILEELPVTFDIVFLYVSDQYYRPGTKIEGKRFLIEPYYHQHLSAYLISKKGANKLLNLIKMIDHPIEIMINQLVEEGKLEAYMTNQRPFANIGERNATQDNLLSSNINDSQLFEPKGQHVP